MTLYMWTLQQTTPTQSTETSRNQEGAKSRGTVNTTTRTATRSAHIPPTDLIAYLSPISGHFGSKVLKTYL